MDGGVPGATTSSWAREPGARSAAIATSHLTAGMVEPGDRPGPAVPVCRPPRARVEASEGCTLGEPYPECRWRMPAPERSGFVHTRWRNTTLEHWWGRPALVSTVLAVARGYADRFGGERLVVGDLDAPGPRHETHDRGVDVDLYLPGVMRTDNDGLARYPSNYRDRPHLLVTMRRARVRVLARLLASCAGGGVRIYYNDPPVEEDFNRWFLRQGFQSPFGEPMQAHNALHEFHFHVTIHEGLQPHEEVTPILPETEGASPPG